MGGEIGDWGPLTASSRVVVAFVKDPDRDPVKTRLAQTIGFGAAAVFYRQCLAVLCEQLQQCHSRGERIVLATTDVAPGAALQEAFAPLSGSVVWLWQGTGDIGERINRVDREIRRFGSINVICFMGSDAPTLPGALITRAWDALNANDFYLCPALDGGFILLAANVLLPDLSCVRWSQTHTFCDTWSLLEQRGLSGHLGDAWYDIDEWPDLLRLVKELGGKGALSRAEQQLHLFLRKFENSFGLQTGMSASPCAES